MKESPYTVTTFDPKNVITVGDYLVIKEGTSKGETYRITHVDGATITYKLSPWDKFTGWLQRLRWKFLEFYYDAVDWLVTNSHNAD
jgi:hypothetical protein